ncbi:MAG: hypothetical protein M1120_02330 [Patescibacteria group bacterium]|nr:hypothetical protein [Patescibacteria group bacterium]
MLLNKKTKIAGLIKSFIKIFLFIAVIIFFGFILIKGWEYGPSVINKYSIIMNNTLLKPVSREDSLTKLGVILSGANLPVVSLQNIDINSAQASLSGNIQVTFSLTKDFSNQVATLQVILARFRIEGRRVNRIDLRFNNAVVN